ncbi:hypothetical protein F2Q68_00044028 [Brassica cretica]|uniref:DOG1 domain-containing protein n=2 Tax=Brassica cretica TaxID=69181 RepID=A0ABQ7AUG0_BRACR|nr:hypothetical protein F2Q68_00044028 [Brassica cretica]KAF3517797.1 hypothetical protein DY000_02060061 [Brassica cretica]
MISPRERLLKASEKGSWTTKHPSSNSPKGGVGPDAPTNSPIRLVGSVQLAEWASWIRKAIQLAEQASWIGKVVQLAERVSLTDHAVQLACSASWIDQPTFFPSS